MFQANAHVKFADGMKKMRFFVRAYQAIKSSKDDSKKSHLDLGVLNVSSKQFNGDIGE